MRRTFILLALLLAGLGGDRATPPGREAAQQHQLSNGDGSIPAAFVRAPSGLPPVAWQDGSGRTTRTFSRRADSDGGSTWSLRALRATAAFAAHDLKHQAYSASFALLRAGQLSFHTATPPPSRSV